jgi:hypothetical protein
LLVEALQHRLAEIEKRRTPYDSERDAIVGELRRTGKDWPVFGVVRGSRCLASKTGAPVKIHAGRTTSSSGRPAVTSLQID